ncbi:type II secretion system F family protein [Agromyces arachidis]|uniref:type II secretion system F family protein n=1 Tax=Agromyces arachidis TaxID=766966 RepID=UPI0040565442
MEFGIVAYIGIFSVAIGIAVFVFLLFPGRAPVSDETGTDGGPLVQQSSIGRRLVTAAPEGYIGWFEKQIAYAGRPVGLTAAKILRTKIILGIVGIVVGLLIMMTGFHPLKLLLAIALTLILFFFPDVRIYGRAHERQEQIRRTLPDTLDQMTIAVEAGLGFDAAMGKAARGGSGPLAEEMIRVLQDMSLGRTRRDSFHQLEFRTNVEELRRFVRAVVQADIYGIALGDVLRVQAGEMRLKRRQRAEEQAQKVGIKILFPLVFCLLPVLLIVILTPAIRQMLDTFSGG